jgi:hypothetical protein
MEHEYFRKVVLNVEKQCDEIEKENAQDVVKCLDAFNL